MGPMPPAQGAPAPQAPAPQGPAPGAGGAAQLLTLLHEGLMKLAKISASNPQAQQAVAGLIKQFESVASVLAGGPQGGGPAPMPQRGNAPMEAGANPNARPL